MLAMAERAPAPFSRIVGRFPRWIVQECTQPTEMLHVQMVLLPAQWRDFGCLSIGPPDLVAPLGFLRGLSVTQLVLPDGKPFFKNVRAT
jgi:hypothetical protein